MSDTSIDFYRAIFSKTAIGQQEVQSRTLRLHPLVRRLLILVDGKRSGQELATFVDGHAAADLLNELLTQKCVEVSASLPAATAAAPAPATRGEAVSAIMDNTALANLPPPENRSAKEVEMARNFMINTVNMEFGLHMRLSLTEAISNCATADQLRQVYPLWSSTMASSRSAAKELPALTEKLLRVL
ncbi:hypothetical protein [Rhodoferax sp.]|uniref:hypothetical protein n=1 Tax=Rhodoferax sp. TaxID=50421 RepID=UPI002844FFB7|nr:hypothetical protein [Rhodoferax sp.]MDR3368562.1 hypothetical protein [Rhodoferax sp.]